MKTSIILFSFVSLLFVTLLISCGSSDTSSTDWSFTFKEIDGNATLDMDGVIIVFEGEKRSGSSSGDITVSQSGSVTTLTVGADDRKLSIHHSNGINTMKFRNYEFLLLDEGNRLSIQGTDVDLSHGKKIVTVKEDGSVITEDI